MQGKWWIVVLVFLLGTFGIAGLTIFLILGGTSGRNTDASVEAPPPSVSNDEANQTFNELTLLTSRLPESCEMRLTLLRVLHDHGPWMKLVDTNPFLSSDPEFIDGYIQALELPSLPHVNSVMIAFHYADYEEARRARGSNEPDYEEARRARGSNEPDYGDEVGWGAFEFASVGDAGKAATLLISTFGNDPARSVLFLKERVLVYLFRDNENYGSEWLCCMNGQWC
jgi:hypothetical protein